MDSVDQHSSESVAIVLDGTVLSNFARIGRLDLLKLATGGAAVTTEAVVAEFDAGRALGYFQTSAPEWLPELPLTEQENETFQVIHQRLGRGEAQCLALAQHRALCLATDDGDARRYARRVGVAVSGTIGILVGLVRTGSLSLEAANTILAEMLDQGYRSPLADLSSLL